MNMPNLNMSRSNVVYTAGGIIVLAAILVLANLNLSLSDWRFDFTQGRVYTLSAGTKKMLAKLEAPVTIRYYASRGGATPVDLQTFASRVEDLLREYQRAAPGKIVVETANPEPDTDAEESATLDGIQAQLTETREKFYLGLSVAFLDQKSVLPVLAPDRERLLEYDITRAISRVSAASKPVIGVMSALPVLGRSLDLATRQQPSEPWVLMSELQSQFTVQKVELNASSIPDAIKVLLVIHPRDISTQTEYALDQFVLRGGKLIAFVDPYSYFDQQPDMQSPLGGNKPSPSTFNVLMQHWGYTLDTTKVVADLGYATGTGTRLLPTLLTLPQEALDKDDLAISRVGNLLIPFGGKFTGKPADGLRATVLARTTKNASLFDLIIATLTGEPSTRGYEPSNEEYPIALRLSGTFTTAFPDGPPGQDIKPPPGKAGAAKADAAKPAAPPSLKTSAQENSVVLVADVDMLTDGAAVEIQDVFGQRVAVPRNGNLNFAQSLVEQVAGDLDLANLRGRAAFARPLTVIQQMESRAQQSYLGKIKSLEDTLTTTQEKLVAMQKQRSDAQSTIISPEQQQELENFRKKSIETRRDLKELRKTLRADSESLQFWTKLANIGAAPLLVMLAGLVLWRWRRRDSPKVSQVEEVAA